MSKHRYEGLLVLNVKGKEDGAQKVIERIEKDFKAEGFEVESVQKMDNRHFSYVAGKLDRFFDTPRDVRELCKEVAFAPFPELERLTR